MDPLETRCDKLSECFFCRGVGGVEELDAVADGLDEAGAVQDQLASGVPHLHAGAHDVAQVPQEAAPGQGGWQGSSQRAS